MTAPRYQVHFLSPNAPTSSSEGKASTNRKSVEAVRAEARSHAARVSHPGSKGSRSRPRNELTTHFVTSGSPSTASSSPASETKSKARPPSTSRKIGFQVNGADKKSTSNALPILRFRLHVENGKNTRHITTAASRAAPKSEEEDLAKRRERAASVPSSLPREITRSALDPFVTPPFELSVPDEHLLHLYLSAVPDQIYGTAAKDVSSVVRHGTVGVVATNEIVVMWLLLVIESQVVSFQPTRMDRELSILTRRSVVYRLMNERLADQKTSLADDYILAVSVAGASEHRMGNTKGAQYHLRATRKLLEMRGGLSAVRHITYPLGLMIVNTFIEQGIDGIWKTPSDLGQKVSELSQWMRDVQSWNFSLRYQAAQALQASEEYPTPESDKADDSLPLSSNDYCKRARAFAAKTALFDYVALPQGQLDNAQCRFYLSILFAINRALFAFRDSEITMDAYLAGVTSAVEMSALHNFTLRAGGAKLPSLLLLLMIAHHAVDVGERNPQTEVVFHAEEVNELVEIMMMASLDTRMHVLRAFASWLTTPMTNISELSFVNNANLLVLMSEVEEKWLPSVLPPPEPAIG